MADGDIESPAPNEDAADRKYSITYSAGVKDNSRPSGRASIPPMNHRTYDKNENNNDSISATTRSEAVLHRVQEHRSGGDVTQHRLVSGVGALGVIETGLGRRAVAQRRNSDDMSSLGGDTTMNRSALTGGTSKPGRCIVKKCTVPVGRSRKGRQEEKVLLHPMRVDLPNGSMTAIVGPANSGKSTLMKFLSGSLDRNVTFQGSANLPGTRSYLGEETNLCGFYTPQTYMKHYDRLTTGLRKGGKTQKEIDGILHSLGILEDRQNVVVGDIFRRGLSAGERRRLDLGLMVLGAPDTLFCEEPTGSLDTETSSSVMQFLKGYSSQPGRRVIITLNQPSSMVWNMIDNVILLAEGKVIYEGPRFDMESFFAFNKAPTPKRFSQIEHYLSVVSRLSKKKKRDQLTVAEWADSFVRWQEQADEDEGDMLADDIETCFPTAITTVEISRSEVQKSRFLKKSRVWLELTRRYMLDLILNPGIMWVRFAMYSMLSLMIGLLFLGLGERTSTTSILSRSSVLFYQVSFFIFMCVAVLPFRVHDKAVAKKEVANSYYHPLAHHFTSTFASCFCVLALAFITTVIIVPMAKFHSPFKFFLNMLLSLNCAEALAQLATLLVSNYIVGIVGLAGLFGFFMLLMGFMLVPSEFPIWLRWAYNVPFHTYTWRSFMYIEFSGPENVFESEEFPTGMDVLRAYEIDNVNYGHDMAVLVGYAFVIHLICIGIILIQRRLAKSIEKETNEEEASKHDGGL